MGRAVSPIVGLIALALATLIVVTGAAFLVFSGGPSTSAYGVTTSVSQSGESGAMSVTVNSFGEADAVLVREANVPSNQVGYSARIEMNSSRNSVRIGDGINDQPVNEVNDPGPLEAGETFEVIAVKDGEEKMVRTVTYQG